jgi:hypothetical protein
LLLVTAVVIVLLLRSGVLTLLLLASVLLSLGVEFFLASLCDSFNDIIIFFLLLDWIDPGTGLGLVLGAKLNGGQPHGRVQVQREHRLEIDDSSEIW